MESGIMMTGGARKIEDDMLKLLKEICAAEEEFRGNSSRTHTAMRYLADKARHIIAEIESPDTV